MPIVAMNLGDTWMGEVDDDDWLCGKFVPYTYLALVFQRPFLLTPCKT